MRRHQKIEFVTGGWSGLLAGRHRRPDDMMWTRSIILRSAPEQADFVTYLTAANRRPSSPRAIRKNQVARRCLRQARKPSVSATVEEATFRDLSKKCATDGKKEISLVTYPDMPGGTRLIANDRADVMTTDLNMVNSSSRAIRLLSTRVHDSQRLQDRRRYPRGNKDLGQAILDGLTVLKGERQDEEIFEK